MLSFELFVAIFIIPMALISVFSIFMALFEIAIAKWENYTGRNIEETFRSWENPDD